MRRIMLWVTVAALMAAMMGAGALPAVAEEDGAEVHIRSSVCSARPPISPHELVTNDIYQVATPSGQSQLTCEFEGPAIEEMVIVESFSCGTGFGNTTDSRFVCTKSGQATLICQVNPGVSEST